MSTDNSRIKILVELMHGIGDTVCALPMLKVLRDSYPQAEITILVKTQAGKDIIKSSHIDIDKICVFDIYNNLVKSLIFLMKLRKYHFTYGISSCVTPVKKARYFMNWVCPYHWIGWQKQGLFFDLLNGKYHFVEANLLSIQEICLISEKKMYPKLYPEQEMLDEMKKKISLKINDSEKKIGVCIGNADYTLKNKVLRTGKVFPKAWGIHNMMELIEKLQLEGFIIILIGGKQEMFLERYVKESIDSYENIINFVGKTSMKESIALASLCDCIIGVDTGMMHIASAVQTYTVSIFGPTNPKTQGVYSVNSTFVTSNSNCQNCYGSSRYINCSERTCLTEIKVDEIVQVVKLLLV